MKYKTVDSCEWTYPDVHTYETEGKSVKQSALQGGIATFQIHIWDVASPVKVKAHGIAAEFYEQIPIPVEANPNFEKEILPESRLKTAPFKVNDCLATWKGEASPREGSVGIYVTVTAPSDAEGEINGNLVISCGDETAEIPVTLLVYEAPLPAETLQIIMGYRMYTAAKWHGASDDRDRTEEIDTLYLKMLRRQHQNRMYIDPPRMIEDEKGGYTFDFTFFNARIKKALSLGFTSFHLFGVGFRKAWDSRIINVRGMNCLSYDAYAYLHKYLGALRDNLRENGWLDKNMFSIGIADEPNEHNALTFRALCGIVRRLFPEIKLYDAVSDAPLHGALDIWIPRSDYYEKNHELFDSYKAMGDEVWHYTCLYPRDDGYINRFMDIPLLATRYLYWGNYKYGLTGYLHWATNVYENDVDPFTASCPRHVNAGSASTLPAGDDKLIYPGDDGPWMSMRLEAYRESAEEYEMLTAISQKDKATADKLCERGFRSFHDVTYNGKTFRALREDIIKTYAELFHK